MEDSRGRGISPHITWVASLIENCFRENKQNPEKGTSCNGGQSCFCLLGIDESCFLSLASLSSSCSVCEICGRLKMEDFQGIRGLWLCETVRKPTRKRNSWVRIGSSFFVGMFCLALQKGGKQSQKAVLQPFGGSVLYYFISFRWLLCLDNGKDQT